MLLDNSFSILSRIRSTKREGGNLPSRGAGSAGLAESPNDSDCGRINVLGAQPELNQIERAHISGPRGRQKSAKRSQWKNVYNFRPANEFEQDGYDLLLRNEADLAPNFGIPAH